MTQRFITCHPYWDCDGNAAPGFSRREGGRHAAHFKSDEMSEPSLRNAACRMMGQYLCANVYLSLIDRAREKEGGGRTSEHF